MNNRDDDKVKMLNDGNPEHKLDTETVQQAETRMLNRHERRKAMALARRKRLKEQT